MEELEKKYNHDEVEKDKYQKWLDKDYFKCEEESDKKPFCIVLPPPNVTGVLHLGHAWDVPGAFSCLDDGQFNEPVAESAYRAAQEALNGYDPSYGAIYYFNPATATSRWIWSRPLIVTIGSHRFCA